MALELKTVLEVKGNFWVPAYQRGYRWGREEVTQLLDDIWELKNTPSDERMYCLQPLVVKKLDNAAQQTNGEESTNTDRYELIDGQQRLNTLYFS